VSWDPPVEEGGERAKNRLSRAQREPKQRHKGILPTLTLEVSVNRGRRLRYDTPVNGAKQPAAQTGALRNRHKRQNHQAGQLR
jgi:hypothetical protein